MAESKTVSVIPLNGTNYPSWKVQCRMALVREGLWGIVAGTKEPPNKETDADRYAKFMLRRDKALATIILAIAPSLLYLIGDPEDPAAVWRKLSGQFQKRTWANKLSLRKKLFTMKLGDSGPMREYIKTMMEIFDELAIVAEPISDEDKVVYLLAGLPESYDMLVTSLESGSDTLPALESMTKHLLREEWNREEADDSKKLLMIKGKKLFMCMECSPLVFAWHLKFFQQWQMRWSGFCGNRVYSSLITTSMTTSCMAPQTQSCARSNCSSPCVLVRGWEFP